MPAATGAAAFLTAWLLPHDACAADPRKDAPLPIPPRATESTLLNLGFVAVSIHTEDIVLGAAPLPLRPDGSLSFAASPTSGSFTVTGMARAAITLSLNLGDLFADRKANIPLPLGGAGHGAKASLTMEPNGKLSISLGTSFGFASSRSGGSGFSSGNFKLNTNPLRPWKHTTLVWHIQF